jgi:hypothetical protein
MTQWVGGPQNALGSIDAIGRSEQEIKNLLGAAHRAMLSGFPVPERDRYQIYPLRVGRPTTSPCRLLTPVLSRPWCHWNTLCGAVSRHACVREGHPDPAFGPKVVTYVLDTLCHPCVRAGPVSGLRHR